LSTPLSKLLLKYVPIQNPYKKAKRMEPSTSEATGATGAKSSKSIEVAAGTQASDSDDVESDDLESIGIDEDEKIDYSSLNLSEVDMKWISFCLQTTHSTASMEEIATAMACPQLKAPPSTIEDKFSSVTGDGHHFMERPSIPIRHSLKKSYNVALREAWYCWEPTQFRRWFRN
jgi:hypothetical protein